MTIQIDDALWGCIIGPVLIGGLRAETDEFHCEQVRVEFFQGDAFKGKAYLTEARHATKRILDALHREEGEPVEICRGYIHAQTKAWLSANHIPWREGVIEGRLQGLIEAEAKRTLAELGFHYSGSMEKYGALFVHAVSWLKGGNLNAPMLPERIQFAKTGWASFPFYRDLPYEQARAAAQRGKRSAQERERSPEDGSISSF